MPGHSSHISVMLALRSEKAGMGMENAAGCQRWETVLMNLDSKGSVHSLKLTANAPEK